MFKIVRTTIIGGIVFLVPIVVFVAITGKAVGLARKMSDPIVHALPVVGIDRVVLAELVAIVLLVVICFVAGLIARTAIAQRAVRSLEANVLLRLAPYVLLKTKAQSVLNPDEVEGMTAVVVRFDDSWQVAFEIERVEGGTVALFLPGSPDPWSGSVCVVEAERVRPLDATIPIVAKMARRLGKGSNEMLRDHLASRAELV